MSARSIRVSPAPDLPTWAHTPADYASPQRTDGMDEEIGANGSIAGLFVEDDEKVGLFGHILPGGCKKFRKWKIGRPEGAKNEDSQNLPLLLDG